MNLGDRVETRRTFAPSDLDAFFALSGAEPVDRVPEPLIAALFSYLLGVHLPGPGTNYLKQELKFTGTAPLDTELTASVEVTRLRPDRHLVDLLAQCRLPDGMVICEGRSLVKAQDTDV